METPFANFHDEQSFGDFSINIEPDLLNDPETALMQSVEKSYDFLDLTNPDVWGTEESLNQNSVFDPCKTSPLMSQTNNGEDDLGGILSQWVDQFVPLDVNELDLNISGISDKFNNSILDFNESANLDYNDVTNINEIAPTITFDGAVVNTTFIEQSQSSISSVNNSSSGSQELPEEKTSKKKSKKHNKFEKSNESKNNDKKNERSKERNKSKKKNKKDKKHTSDVSQSTDNEECIDVVTVSDDAPVLEAKDLNSLLEQFEATEQSSILFHNEKPEKVEHVKHKSKQPEVAKIAISSPVTPTANKISQSSKTNLHKNIRDTLPKEVIDRIKASSVSSKRKTISVIPPKPVVQGSLRNTNSKRKESKKPSLSQSKLMTIVARSKSSGVVSLDHDYCCGMKSPNSVTSSDSSNSEFEKQLSDCEVLSVKKKLAKCLKKVNKNSAPTAKHPNHQPMQYKTTTTPDSKKDSGLESGETSDNTDEQSANKSPLNNTKPELIVSKPNIPIRKSVASVPEMKIRSALATRIIQSRNGVITKTGVIQSYKGTPMVSVLKKMQIPSPQENVVSTVNNSNTEVQNIVMKNSEEPQPAEKEKQSKKISIAEYKKRRAEDFKQMTTKSSVILIGVHHASTSTSPLNSDPNPIYCVTEVEALFKTQEQIDKAKSAQKPATCEISTQTYNSIFSHSPVSETEITKKSFDETKTSATTENTDDTKEILNLTKTENIEEKENKNIVIGERKVEDKKTPRSYRKRSLSRSSRSTSKSRSKSTSRSTSRSRNIISGRSRGRKRTRKYNKRNASHDRSTSRSTSRSRRKRVKNHRHNSVTSDSSYSSRSRRSYTSSRSGYSRSRSHSRRRTNLGTNSTSRSRSSSLTRSRTRSRTPLRSRTESSSTNSTSPRYSSSRFGHPHQNRYNRYNHNYYYNSGYQQQANSVGHQRSPCYRRPFDTEKQRQVEERRVVYVGRIEDTVTKSDLRKRFEAFGTVLDVSLHFREAGDNYGFVTYAYKNDAYKAIERGNSDPSLPRYELCFGGRRAFCKVKYADLDNGEGDSYRATAAPPPKPSITSFDALLKEAQIRQRKV